MRWKDRRQSTQIDDRRGRRNVVRGGAAIGGGGLLIVLLLTLLTGEDPSVLLDALDPGGPSAGVGTNAPGPVGPRADDEQAQMVSVVLADTEETWSALFATMGRTYELPALVLFDDVVASACGTSSAAVGPFYCPADRRVYLDLSFFSQLERRFGAPGDFAQAYVVAHEVGHHVQNLLGISSRVQQLQAQGSRAEGNRLSVRLELQADCLAGVWGYHANQRRALLEPGDVEEGLAAAAAIGDDTLQRQAGRAVSPESWTHGSSAERARWLTRGLETGDPGACDTFGG